MLEQMLLVLARILGVKVVTRSQIDDLLFSGYRMDVATLLKSLGKERKQLGKKSANDRRKADQMRAKAVELDQEALEADKRNSRLAQVEKQLQ